MSVNVIERAVLVVEATWAKHTVHLDPEPPGARTGVVRASASPALQLTMVGDSMVVACGTAEQSEGMVPRIARRLSDDTGRPVEWRAHGQLGATIRRVRYRLLPDIDDHPDLLIICAGSNDLTAGRTEEEWTEDLGAVLDSALDQAGRVVLLGPGQLYRSPALPPGLRREIDTRTEAQTAASREVCARRQVAYIDLTRADLAGDPAFWAGDGYHPSAYGYEILATAVTDRLSHLRDRA